jgi:putative phosphoribosyl transferase
VRDSKTLIPAFSPRAKGHNRVSPGTLVFLRERDFGTSLARPLASPLLGVARSSRFRPTGRHNNLSKKFPALKNRNEAAWPAGSNSRKKGPAGRATPPWGRVSNLGGNTGTARKRMSVLFENRAEAGRLLGKALQAYAGRQDVIVLALPRGGVPVGFEVARLLAAPLDLLLVRKLGTPGREELAMGAIASGGVSVLNKDVVTSCWIDDETIEAVAVRERRELERRERLYRGERPVPEIKGCCVILVDDGLATGATMLAGVAALRQRLPARIVVAVPVASARAVERLRTEADEVVCLAVPEPFLAVGQWYREFGQTDDEEVKALLAQARGETAA